MTLLLVATHIVIHNHKRTHTLSHTPLGYTGLMECGAVGSGERSESNHVQISVSVRHETGGIHRTLFLRQYLQHREEKKKNRNRKDYIMLWLFVCCCFFALLATLNLFSVSRCYFLLFECNCGCAPVLPYKL